MINIIENYAITADDKQYILVKKAKRVDKETGEACWGTLGYYMTVPQALTSLMEHLYRKRVREHSTELDEAVQAYKEVARGVWDWWEERITGGADA